MFPEFIYNHGSLGQSEDMKTLSITTSIRKTEVEYYKIAALSVIPHLRH